MVLDEDDTDAGGEGKDAAEGKYGVGGGDEGSGPAAAEGDGTATVEGGAKAKDAKK